MSPGAMTTPGGVHALVAHQALERPGGVDDLLGHRVVGVGLGQLGARLHGVLEPDADRPLGHELGDAVNLPVAVAEHAPGVAHDRPGQELAERADAGHGRRAVLVGHVLHHPVAAGHREVGVDVGHAPAPRVEEALEQEPVGQRVEVDDPERVGHQRPGRRAAPGADRDPVLARPAHVVPDDQEVAGEAHLADHAQLEAQALVGAGRRAVRVAGGQALAAEALQEGLGALAAGDREARELDVAQGQPEGRAALGDLDRDRDRVDEVGQGGRHLGARLEEELLGVEAEATRVAQQVAGLDRQQRLVGVGVLAAGVVGVAGGDQRQAGVDGEPAQVRVDRGL